MRRTGNTADRAVKGEVKDAWYIIVTQLIVWYNFNVVDSDRLSVYKYERRKLWSFK